MKLVATACFSGALGSAGVGNALEVDEKTGKVMLEQGYPVKEVGMKLSEMQESMILNHLRLHPDFVSDEDKTYIEALKSASIAFVEEYCGIDAAYMDAHEELAIAVLVLIGDMYDNRTRYVDKANLNRTVETILSLHDHNLIDDAT